ncbi:MAG TPA: hypothetical protein VGN42_18485 [Pirellulales bacterium]|jgi:hypothetical protein|nr:hypothetical protein [Pirellulales bacterium]
MDRFFPRSRYGLPALAAALALAAPQFGCVKLLTTAVYLVKGTDTAAEYTGLKDKRVVVVCRPLTELTYSCSGAASDLAAELGRKLKANLGRRIKVVDPDEVADWTDENPVEDYAEIGRALDADMVVGIDLLGFSTLLGQTLQQGKAQVKVSVHDLKQDGKVVYEKNLPQVVYPLNNGVPIQDKPEDEFRREYIKVLADEIGRSFYASDHFSRYARGTSALEE